MPSFKSHKRFQAVAKAAGSTLLAFAVVALALAAFLQEEGNPEFIVPAHPLPTFKDANLKEWAGFVLPPGEPFPVLASERRFIDHKLFRENFPGVPLLRPTQAHLVAISERRLWCSQDVAAFFDDAANGWRIVPRFGKAAWFLPLSLSALAAAAFCLPGLSAGAGGRLVACVFHTALWLGFALYTIHVNGLFLVYVGGDAKQFYDIAVEWLSCRRHTPIPNSVGTAWMYMPLILALRPLDYFDVALPAAFATMLIYPAAVLPAIFLIAERLGAPLRCAHAAAGAFTLFSLTALVRGYPGATLLSPFMRTDAFSLFLYNKGFLLGCNGMSDNHGVIIPVLGMLALVSMRPSILRYVLMGVFLGFGISTRYANIMLLPAVFFWDLSSPGTRRLGAKKILLFYSVFALAGLAGVAPQLADNFLVNGNPLHPTVLPRLFKGEEKVVNLFSVDNLHSGLSFYASAHFKIMTLFACALFCLSDRRAAFFLWLWAACPLLFYASTNFHMHNELRYVLCIFPPIFIGLGLCAAGVDRRALLFAAASIAATMCVSCPELPFFRVFDIPAPLPRLTPLALGGLAAAVSLATGRSKAAALCFASMMLALSTGLWWVPAGMLCIFPLHLALSPLTLPALKRMSSAHGAAAGARGA